MATKENFNLAENVQLREEQNEVNTIISKRVTYFKDELEKIKSQSKTNSESLTKLSILYDDLENLRSQITTDKKEITNTSNKLSYLLFFTALIAIISAVVVWIV